MSIELLEQVRHLPLEDRAQLWDELWLTMVADGYEPATTAAQRIELENRVAEHRADPTGVVPWDEVKAGIKARFGYDL